MKKTLRGERVIPPKNILSHPVIKSITINSYDASLANCTLLIVVPLGQSTQLKMGNYSSMLEHGDVFLT